LLQGERNYLLFASGEIKTFQGIFSKAELHPDSTQCILKALKEHFSCITSDIVIPYTMLKIPRVNDGKPKLQISNSRTNFVEGEMVSSF